LLWSFSAALFAALLFLLTMGLGIPALVLAAVCFISWLWAIFSAVRTHGARGLWTLITTLIFMVPAYMSWFLMSGCPGANVCF
jgi:hypothetical protein